MVTRSPVFCSFPRYSRRPPGCRRGCPVGPVAPGSAIAVSQEGREGRQGEACEIRAKNKHLTWLLEALPQLSGGWGEQSTERWGLDGWSLRSPGPRPKSSGEWEWGGRQARGGSMPGGWNRGPAFFIHSAFISAPYSMPTPLHPCLFIPLFHSLICSLSPLVFISLFIHLLSPLVLIPSFIHSLAHPLLYSSILAPDSPRLQGAATCLPFSCPPWQAGRG